MRIMITEVGSVRLIHAKEDGRRAEEIRTYLEERFAESKKAPRKAAVILLSDAAVEDKEGWQDPIAGLGDDVRLIPVGRTENANFSKMVPKRIREINYIRADEDMLANIYDSVMIDSDFYRMRSEVLLQMESWEASGRSDAFLMTDGRKIRKYRRMTAEKTATEADPRFKAQLEEMEEYLALSARHARKIFFYSFRRWAAVGVMAVLFAFFVIAARYLVKSMERANREAALLGAPRDEAKAAENVILLCDGITNLTIDSRVRTAFLRELFAYLDLNWCTTPIGYNYKHELMSAYLMKDERYLATSASNGKMLFWDTYSGRIVKEEDAGMPFKAFYTDSENHVQVIVQDDNKIRYGISGEWLSNDTPQYFDGESRIHIYSNKDHILIHDSKFLYYLEWSAEGPAIRPVSYLADDMIEGAYTISSAQLTDTGYTAALKYKGSLYLFVSDGPDYNMEMAPSEKCNTANRGGMLLFSDSEGNIMLFRNDRPNVEPVGLRLPDPRILCFVNDTTIAYHDGLLGTHLYDIDQNIDMGELFSSFSELTELEISGSSAVCKTNGTYVCQSIGNLLPRRELDPQASLVSNSESVTGDGQIRSVTPAGIGTVEVKLLANGEEKELIVTCSGKASTVGIIDNGHGVVIGTEDGSFREVVFRDNGSPIPCTSIRIPSHSAIRSVWETEDCYWLMDEAGNYWWARLGYAGTENPDLSLDQINNKLHHGVTKELLDSISKETIDNLGLQMMPGGDGKEWE